MHFYVNHIMKPIQMIFNFELLDRTIGQRVIKGSYRKI